MNFQISSKTYDMLKWVTLVLLPALSTLYMALSSVWPLPFPNEVVGTIAAIVTFLGVLLGLSSLQKLNTARSYDHNHDYAYYIGWVLSDQWYTVLRYLTQIALPAFATLYFTLASIWSLPNPDQVVATIMAIVTFLGMVLQFSSAQHSKLPTSLVETHSHQ